MHRKSRPAGRRPRSGRSRCSRFGLSRRWGLLTGSVLILLLFAGCSSRYTVPRPESLSYEGEINRHSRLIRADSGRVFQILTDEDRFETICPPGTVVTHEPPKPFQAGTVVSTRIDHIFKLRWRSQVTEVVPGKKIRQQFLDGFFAGGTELWELDTEKGFTRTTHTIIVQPRGLLRQLAWKLKVRRKHDTMVEAFLDNLKRVAESP